MLWRAPVVAGAVIIPASFFSEARNRKATEEMNDSKQFDETTRENSTNGYRHLESRKRYLRERDRRVWRRSKNTILWGLPAWR